MDVVVFIDVDDVEIVCFFQWDGLYCYCDVGFGIDMELYYLLDIYLVNMVGVENYYQVGFDQFDQVEVLVYCVCCVLELFWVVLYLWWYYGDEIVWNQWVYYLGVLDVFDQGL